jgi:hypothetical protein
MRVYGNRELEWKGTRIGVKGQWRTGPVLEIVPDAKYPAMWRVTLPGGGLSDMVNRPRAMDAARAWLLGILNRQDTPVAAPPIAPNEQGAGETGVSIEALHEPLP